MVLRLTNALRRKGIDASCDAFITQEGTVNLNMMMISQIRDCDYIILVLTEHYASKADEVQGGVGYETILTASYIQENLNKLIPIMRHKGNFEKVFPFHLKGTYTIDFSRDEEFDEKLEELAYKICKIPFYEVEPLGQMPDLKPKVIDEQYNTNNNSALIPKLKKTTEKEKSHFLQDAYRQMLGKFKSLFEQTKEVNEEFDYTYEQLSNRKSIYKAYVNGSIRTGMKIWYGNSIGFYEGIYLSYGSSISENSDNSCNEIITCEMNNSTLQLKQTMSFFGNSDKNDVDSVVQRIWIEHMKSQIER